MGTVQFFSMCAVKSLFPPDYCFDYSLKEDTLGRTSYVRGLNKLLVIMG